jgi:hypothetical protein
MLMIIIALADSDNYLLGEGMIHKLSFSRIRNIAEVSDELFIPIVLVVKIILAGSSVVAIHETTGVARVVFLD